MRNMLVLGSLLSALIVTGCSDAALIADLKCGKDGKIRGELEFVVFGNEESQAEIDDLTCEERKEARKELKAIKVAIGTVENDEFTAVVYAKKYEVEDENCDGYDDISYEFSVKKLVCAGLLDKDTEELAVGVYFDCELEGWDYFAIENEEENDCEEQKECDGQDQQTSDGCDKKEYKKDCNNEQPS